MSWNCWNNRWDFHSLGFMKTSRVPVEGKSSVCLICMKYRILNYYILVIIIISLGEILLSYNANTSRTHARTHACTHSSTRTHTHTPPSPFRFDAPVAPKHEEVNAHFRCHSWPVAGPFKQAHALATRFQRLFWCFRTISRPNWDTNSWQDVLSGDTNS